MEPGFRTPSVLTSHSNYSPASLSSLGNTDNPTNVPWVPYALCPIDMTRSTRDYIIQSAHIDSRNQTYPEWVCTLLQVPTLAGNPDVTHKIAATAWNLHDSCVHRWGSCKTCRGILCIDCGFMFLPPLVRTSPITYVTPCEKGANCAASAHTPAERLVPRPGAHCPGRHRLLREDPMRLPPPGVRRRTFPRPRLPSRERRVRPGGGLTMRASPIPCSIR